MYTKVYRELWMLLPKEQRQHLVVVFNISRTGVTEIRDQDIISDGHSNMDLEVISAEKMAEYTGSPATEPFHRLWEITVSKSNYELNPPINIPTIEPIVEEKPLEIIKETNGKKKSK